MLSQSEMWIPSMSQSEYCSQTLHANVFFPFPLFEELQQNECCFVSFFCGFREQTICAFDIRLYQITYCAALLAWIQDRQVWRIHQEVTVFFPFLPLWASAWLRLLSFFQPLYLVAIPQHRYWFLFPWCVIRLFVMWSEFETDQSGKTAEKSNTQTNTNSVCFFFDNSFDSSHSHVLAKHDHQTTHQRHCYFILGITPLSHIPFKNITNFAGLFLSHCFSSSFHDESLPLKHFDVFLRTLNMNTCKQCMQINE